MADEHSLRTADGSAAGFDRGGNEYRVDVLKAIATAATRYFEQG